MNSKEQQLLSQQKKEHFIQTLAIYLQNNQAGKSIALQMERERKPVLPWAQEWAEVRSASGLRGYPDLQETVTHLRELLR